MDNTLNQNQQAEAITQKIGNTTYTINFHFSKTSKEGFADKIKRLLTYELENI